jgi:hypothetical protein
MRVLALLALAACGGGTSPAAGPIVGGAVLAGVSSDLATLATLAAAQRQTNGAFIGMLQLSPAAGGVARSLDANAAAATYARGTTLYYLAGATQVAEGSPVARPRSYGTLKAWLPSQPGPIVLGGTVGSFAVARNGSAVAFLDRATASSAATGTVKVWSTTSAAPIPVASGVASATLVVSDDGTRVLVAVPKTDADPPKVLLVSFPGGTVQTLSTDASARSAMMSPDGATVAWVEAGNNLLVASGLGAPTTIAVAPGPSSTLQAAEMVGATRFVAKVKVGDADPELYLISASAVTPLGIVAPIRFSVVPETPGDSVSSGRWLFFARTQDGVTGVEDLWLLDLASPSSPPVQLATATSGSPTFSDDGTAIRYLDDLDLDTGFGTLSRAALPGATPTRVAAGVRAAAFEPGTDRLLYIADADVATGIGRLEMEGGGSAIPGVANFMQSRAEPALFYTQELGLASDGVYRADEL